ncbi:hypothetical protein Pint_15853 [Pistacia integerrima]|uniref:Uncharacterized protein n=1 Tax=Pistacia integerrima TaxID=434235 RepID=A0ACC0ZDJ5_9ROSI|nr:hypothetical protein Pint_15853 [Pistacia integerrima]
MEGGSVSRLTCSVVSFEAELKKVPFFTLYYHKTYNLKLGDSFGGYVCLAHFLGKLMCTHDEVELGFFWKVTVVKAVKKGRLSILKKQYLGLYICLCNALPCRILLTVLQCNVEIYLWPYSEVYFFCHCDSFDAWCLIVGNVRAI